MDGTAAALWPDGLVVVNLALSNDATSMQARHIVHKFCI